MFIHHEDVRRAVAGWEPRVLDESIVSVLRRQLGLMSRVTLAKVPAQVVLRTPSGRQIARVGRGDAVTVTGEPPELLLFASRPRSRARRIRRRPAVHRRRSRGPPRPVTAALTRDVAEQMPQRLLQVGAAEAMVGLFQSSRQHTLVGAGQFARALRAQ